MMVTMGGMGSGTPMPVLFMNQIDMRTPTSFSPI